MFSKVSAVLLFLPFIPLQNRFYSKTEPIEYKLENPAFSSKSFPPIEMKYSTLYIYFHGDIT